MFLYSLLEVSEQTTSIVRWISVAGVVIVLALIGVIGFFRDKKSWNAKKIAFAGICVCMSFTLALVKFSPVQSGGSITIASFVPILVFAYVYGAVDGFLIGLIHGLLNFIEDPFILTPATFVFDYLLAFMSVGIMGFFGKLPRKEKQCLPVVLGCIAVFSARFVSHLFSGMIFFSQNAVWVDFPAWATSNAFVYSFIYQCIYVPADAIIATFTTCVLCKTGVLDKLALLMRKSKTQSTQI